MASVMKHYCKEKSKILQDQNAARTVQEEWGICKV